MSQFADSGAIVSKPYASTGAYIDRMSDYCGRCRFDVKKRVGRDACPFNALFWDFVGRNEDRLRSNGRMRNMYATWDRFSDASRAEIKGQAETFLSGRETAHAGWERAG